MDFGCFVRCYGGACRRWDEHEREAARNTLLSRWRDLRTQVARGRRLADLQSRICGGLPYSKPRAYRRAQTRSVAPLSHPGHGAKTSGGPVVTRLQIAHVVVTENFAGVERYV